MNEQELMTSREASKFTNLHTQVITVLKDLGLLTAYQGADVRAVYFKRSDLDGIKQRMIEGKRRGLAVLNA